MGSLDFYVDFNIEVPDISDDFTTEAETKLRALASDRSDIVGSAVSLERIADGETPYLYQVRIVVYKRPDSIAVVIKGPEPLITLHNALDVLELKIRESREKYAQVDSHQGGDTESVAYELSEDEVYASYAKGQDPAEILNKTRTEIASSLMVEEGLNQEAAYFAADQIIRVAEKRMNEPE